MLIRTLALLVALAASVSAKEITLLLIAKDGAVRETSASLTSIRATVAGKQRTFPIATILSIHNGAAATAAESERITKGIAAIQGADRKQRDAAVEDLTYLGIPVMTPLLKAYKDTDQHEPRPLYRLFERIMPSDADTYDRELSLIRLTTGEQLRGVIEPVTIGTTKWDDIRALAVKQRSITRRADVHSIRHSTQIEYFDTAIRLSPKSTVAITAGGFTRLSWETDGWASDPDGLKKPGPNYKTNLVDGHPFGALVGRIGASGEVFFIGSKANKTGLAEGKLYLAINDNRHWQNNLGSYQVTVRVTDAYDLGNAQ